MQHFGEMKCYWQQSEIIQKVKKKACLKYISIFVQVNHRRSEVTNLITNIFEPRRYDLSKVGRYKFNKKLALATRIRGHVAAEDLVDGQTGEILVEKGNTISHDIALQIQNSGVNVVNLDVNGKTVRVIGNNTVDIQPYIDFEASSVGITEKVRYDVLQQILNEYSDDEDIKSAIDSNRDLLIPKTITIEDIARQLTIYLVLMMELAHLMI